MVLQHFHFQGELLSANTTAVEPFCSTLKEVMEKEGYNGRASL